MRRASMRMIITSMAALLFAAPLMSHAQTTRAVLEDAASALGASNLTSLEFVATSAMFDTGQSAVPGQRGPQFALKSYARSINYETASAQTDFERSRAEVRGGGAPAPRQIQVVSGDLAWNVVGDVIAPAPVALAERQFQLWATPQGVIKAAMKYNATVDGRTVSFTVPSRFTMKATLNDAKLVEKVDAIVVEAPLNDERALAVITTVRELVPNKPIRYVIASHHHFDHSGGLRAFASVGITVVAHESDRAFLTKAFAAPATLSPDLLAKSGRKAQVEGVRERRVMSDGTRTVEIHHIAGSPHEDGMLMVYLPKEKLLIQADTFTPAPPNAPPPATPNPNSVNLADNITRLKLDVDQHLPLHGRIVPMADLNRAIGRAQ